MNLFRLRHRALTEPATDPLTRAAQVSSSDLAAAILRDRDFAAEVEAMRLGLPLPGDLVVYRARLADAAVA